MSLTSTVHASPSCGFQASPASPQVTYQWTGPTFHLRLTLGTDYRPLTPLRLEFLSSDVPTTSCPPLDLRTLPVLVLSYWPGNPYHPPRFRQRSELATAKSVFFTHSETKLKYTLNYIRVITRCQHLTPGAIFNLIPRLLQ